MFMALVVETILTVIVVDKAGLDVDVKTQVFQNKFIPFHLTNYLLFKLTIGHPVYTLTI